MTSYTDHQDTIFGTHRPILGSTGLEARDNLIALAEGDADAPEINLKALGKFTAGTTLRYLDPLTYIDASPDRISVAGSGTLRLRLKAKNDGGSHSVTIRVNEVTTNTLTISSSSLTTYNFDLTIGLGHVIEVASTTASGTATVQELSLRTNGEQLLPYADLTGWVPV